MESSALTTKSAADGDDGITSKREILGYAALSMDGGDAVVVPAEEEEDFGGLMVRSLSLIS